ncbi:phytoceramidase [Salpingoeca rosetta]|uniref:Phytoceramidase n=1 Tax=Salpingoeca rosetta (strain ATCC 50818 / BSB-021) TaxID=946362 RepID=F2TXK3_SALR5|nr:phytoceramidase [Salpingoeca rosetta]EGD76112.1 phytoceramidase [Salpingoeca rosetta]|eukprot:XP_004998287.1 phytoceramidase [Salpingoeca rosetta]
MREDNLTVGGGGFGHGFWGQPTSSIDWCEENYVVSHYIAEFYNTVSSLVIALFGLYGAMHWRSIGHEPRFMALWASIICVGIGSALFHGTLLFSMQMMDELPMVYAMLVWLYIWIENETETPRKKYLPAFLAAYGVFWTFVHTYLGFATIFQIHFGLLVVAGYTFVGRFAFKTQDPRIKWFSVLYVAPFVLAFALWSTERIFCSSVRPFQFHAWWHVLSGIRFVGLPALCVA